MLKKLAVGVLMMGMLLLGVGGASVLAHGKSASQESIHPFSTAYTDVKVTGKTVYFYIKGMESPFNQTYYERVAWTSTDEEPDTLKDNILSVKIAAKTGSRHEAKSSERLELMKDKIETGGIVYGWAKAQHGNWYPAGSAKIYY
ncbi:enoyl-CoA hydratase [Bacillus swezeyi]|uniref:enoyl-CoA hydratase n=1 Tax=Bacillus swezeyi TaxID=1925020 RepID=UPI003F89A441